MERGEVEEPPGDKPPQRIGPVPAIWRQVSAEQWNDWRWQLRHRITTLEELKQVIRLTPEEEEGVAHALEHLRMAITPYFASLMDPDDPECPIRKQVVPTVHELSVGAGDMHDPLSEDQFSPVPGVLHRYPDRVCILATDVCASYCRHCTRRRLVGMRIAHLSHGQVETALQYVAEHKEVRDVLISGGDPLMLPEATLEMLLSRLRAMEHVEIIRIGTRVPVYLPQRITPQLVGMLRKYHPLFMNIHFNHPREITPEVRIALARLADAGIPLGSQTVLLAGINDCPTVITELMHALVKARVRPYYIYQCDLSEGIEHFRTPVSKGIEIIENLRGHTSGLCVPQFIIDAPGGGGKVPVMPQYLISESEAKVVVRNYSGYISTYTQPKGYVSKCAQGTCKQCNRHKKTGVAALLAGEQLAIGEPAERKDSRPRTRITEEHFAQGEREVEPEREPVRSETPAG